MGIVTNKRAFIDALKNRDKAVRTRFKAFVLGAVTMLHHEVMSLTPVWSGSAVANYQWSIGIPESAYVEPIDNGLPGSTNSMPLGAEPRRPPNEALSLGSLAKLLITEPFQVFWLNNVDPDIMGLEFGLLPTQERSRSPSGMGRLSLEYVALNIATGRLEY